MELAIHSHIVRGEYISSRPPVVSDYHFEHIQHNPAVLSHCQTKVATRSTISYAYFIKSFQIARDSFDFN